MKYKPLRLIGVLCVLCVFAFSQPVDARETLIQLPNGALDKIITDFKGTRVYDNGNLVYSSDVDSHEQAMNKILKSGGSLVSDNKSFSFSISGRVPAIGTTGTTSTSTSTSTSSSAPSSDLTSPLGTTPSDSDLVPDFAPEDEE